MRIKECNVSVDKIILYHYSSDVIIIHAGTNSISNSSPEEFGRDVVETLMKVHENNPKARIGFSTIFRRNDDLNLKAKVAKVNKVVED